MDNSIKSILIVFLLILIFYLLSVLSSLIIPLAFAFLFSVLFQPLIKFLKRKKTPGWVIMPMVSVITLAVLALILNIIIQSATQIASQYDYLVLRFSTKVETFLTWVNSSFALELDKGMILGSISEMMTGEFITEALGGVASSVSSFTGSFFMFALYYVVLLSGMSNYKAFLEYVGAERGDTFIESYERIQNSVISYMAIKVLVSLGTGLTVYVICLLFGLKFALFWAFLTFLLNFIPSIGSTIAIIPPVLMAVIQFDSWQPMLFLLLCIVAVQMIMGNVVEPKIMGNQLRLNLMTVLIGLVFWGYLWGVAGMMLSVPLIVLMKLVFENVPSLSLLGRLMGSPNPK